MDKSKGRKLVLVLLLISCIIGSVLPYFSVFSVWRICDAGFDQNKSTKKMYWAIDALTPEDEAYYFSQTYNMDNMIGYIDAMEDSEELQYCVYGPQTVYYDCGEMKTYEVNMRTIELFPIDIESGSNLEGTDFQYSGTNRISVLVGYNLRDKYPLGAEIHVEFMCTDTTFIVKGIIADGESFPFHDMYSDENNNIIVPSLRFVAGSNDTFLKKAICLQHISGFIVAEKQNKFATIIKTIDKFRDKFGMFNIKFARIDNFAVWVLRLKNNLLLFIFAQVLIFTYIFIRWIILYKSTTFLSSFMRKLISMLSIVLAEIVLCIILRTLLLTYDFSWVYVAPYYAFEMVSAVFVGLLMKRRA